ncbi:2Fe-2S iron-sulfur cluster-binding protein [Pseudooceanicola sp.]|uniref:2Fe-2S iron-sulfur cluster-binding protein n=1 Tax=Pseudooceanicola sp. TaxID=1914328 RepID=UPI0035C68096
MDQFFPLTVTDIHHDTRDAVVVSLKPRPEDADRFAYRPGQYLTFRRDFGGEELRRSYSICATPAEGLRVGIKRVAGGAFSSFAKEELNIGDVVDVMPPQGRFTAPEAPAGHYLLVAGGSGITPVLSIAKTLLQSSDAKVTLIYGNRDTASIMFRAEIAELKDRYLTRFSIVHVFDGEGQEIPLFSGQITEGKARDLFEGWVPVDGITAAYLCGPKPMMDGVAAALASAGLSKEQIHFELFLSDQPGRAARKAEAEAAKAAGDMVTATVIIEGHAHTFDMPRRGQSVLEAARENGLDAPYSCKAGVCSTCMCRLKEGEVEMMQNYALEDYEVERGLVLSCQSIPLTDRITVEYESH